MAYRIPTQNNFRQDNRTDIGGDIWSSFNIDLYRNIGKLSTTRTKLNTSNEDVSNMEDVVAFQYFNNRYFALSDGALLRSGTTLSTPFSDVGSVTVDNNPPDYLYSDLKAFGNRLFYSRGNSLVYSTNGTTWTETSYGAGDTQITQASPHLLEPYAGRLYMTNNFDKVISFDSSSTPVIAASGSNTLDLKLNGGGSRYKISFIKSGNNRLWIGVLDTKGSNGIIYEWDGENENTPSNRYFLDSAGPMAGIVERGESTPTIIDAEGKLLKFNGAGFQEIARLPLGGALLGGLNGVGNNRSIHPNGMIENNGNIQVVVNTMVDQKLLERCPSGVWEYSPNNGFYHKYSVSVSKVGTTENEDYGSMTMGDGGAIIKTNKTDTAMNEPDIIFSSTFFRTSSTDNSFGIFTVDEGRQTQELGYIVTPQLFSQQIEDTWNNLYVRFKEFATDGDKIVVKTRTRDYDPLYFDVAWLKENAITSTEDLSALEVGQEVEIVQGAGAGYIDHIKEISQSSSTYQITLENDANVSSGTAVARFTNWEWQGDITKNYKQWDEIGISETEPWIQIKLVFIGTGDNEFYDLTVVNSGNKEI